MTGTRVFRIRAGGYPAGLYDRLLWLAGELWRLRDRVAFVPGLDPVDLWSVATGVMLRDIDGAAVPVLDPAGRSVEDLLAADGLPPVLLVGRFPAYEPTRRMAEIGRELVSAVWDVPLPVIREFLSARGVARTAARAATGGR